MIRKSTLATTFAVLCCSLAAMAADWPNFFGPTRNGIAPEKGLNKDWAGKPPRELWRVPLTDGGFAGPSVAAGKVFIVDHQGANDIVRAFNLKDGQPAWQYSYADLDKSNYGFAQATPTYSDGLLYTVSRLGVITCLKAADGTLVWSKSMTKDFGGRGPNWLYAESACVDGNRLVICTGAANGNVIALDKRTGATLWTGGNGDLPGYATAVPANMLGQKQYVVCTGFNIIGVAADTGKLLWSFPWENAAKVNASQPIVEVAQRPPGNFVFITSGYGIGCAGFEVTPNGAVERWRNKSISAHFSSPVLYDGFIYSNSDPGNLVCMSEQTGQVIWTQPGFEKGGLMIADGVILAFAGNTGDLIMARADATSYQELGRIKPLGGQSWTAPILADGKLIVRNTQAMVCLDAK